MDVLKGELDLMGELADDCQSLLIHDGKALKHLLQKLHGKKLEISIKPYKEVRSAAQNRYMWGVVFPTIAAFLRETTGERYTSDEIYTWVRVNILGETPVVKHLFGTDVIVLQSKRFSKMNTAEFSDVTDRIVKAMAEKGCYIPPPTTNNHLRDFIPSEDSDFDED